MAIEFKLPELGENISSGKVARLLVSEGDSIDKDQVLMELETDKAVIEVPSDVSGTVSKINVSEGDDVEVGTTVLTLEDRGEAKTEASSTEDDSESDAQKITEKQDEDKEEEKTTSTPPETKKTSGSKQTVEFKVPALGENIDAGTVAKILVSRGDTIEENQNLLELETDKAVVEVPSEHSGTIKEILIKEGDQVSVGQHIITIEGGKAVEEEVKEEVAAPTPEQPEVKEPEPKTSKQPPPATSSTQETKKTPPKEREAGDLVPAAPSVRRFAREIGIDISQVPGSGPGGRISVEDVKSYSKMINRQQAGGQTLFKGVESEPLPDFSKWGEVDPQSMNKVRETTARHLSYAWATIPHVTQFDKADITALEQLRKQYGPEVEKAGGKLTVTAILIKIIEGALKKYPQFNASVDMVKREIIYKKYYNVGIAVDTDRGLLVPVLKNVDQKNITQLSVELTDMSKKARDRKLSLEDMQGGNFSISNLGGIGGTGFAPVVNSPEVAILGVSRASTEPVYNGKEFEPRLILPLALSYDHRLIDGADAARFLRWVCQALEQPFLLSLQG